MSGASRRARHPDRKLSRAEVLDVLLVIVVSVVVAISLTFVGLSIGGALL